MRVIDNQDVIPPIPTINPVVSKKQNTFLEKLKNIALKIFAVLKQLNCLKPQKHTVKPSKNPNVSKISQKIFSNESQDPNIGKIIAPKKSKISASQISITALKSSDSIVQENKFHEFKELFLSFNLDLLSFKERILGLGNQIQNKGKEACSKEIFNCFSDLIKDLGHTWTMKGTVAGIDVEGNASSIMHAKLFKSVEGFFGKSEKNAEKSEILDALKKSIVYSASIEKTSDYKENIPHLAKEILDDYQFKKPITIGSGSLNHAVEITIQDNYLCFTNRGSTTNEENSSNMQVFQIPDRTKLTQTVLEKILTLNTTRLKWIEDPNGMRKDLGLIPITTLSYSGDSPENYQARKQELQVTKRPQKAGNCSWANTKGSLHALLLLSNLNKESSGNPSEQAIIFDEAKKNARKMYKEWSNYSRFETLENFIDRFKELKPHLSDDQITSTTEFLKILLTQSQGDNSFPERLKRYKHSSSGLIQKLKSFFMQTR